MYRIDGSSDLKEDVLDHWRGYRGSAPGARSATAPPSSCSSTSTARRWTASTPAYQRGLPMPPPGLDGDLRGAGLAGRELGPAGGGHLGDPRRAQAVHLRPGDVLGRLRPRHPAGRRARPAGPLERWTDERDQIYRQVMDRGSTTRARHSSSTTTPTSWTRRCCGCPPSGSSTAATRCGESTLRGDGRRAGHRQPGLPLRPGRVTRRAARLGGHVLALHVLLRRRADPGRPARRRPARPSRRCSPTPTTWACTPRRSP